MRKFCGYRKVLKKTTQKHSCNILLLSHLQAPIISLFLFFCNLITSNINFLWLSNCNGLCTMYTLGHITINFKHWHAVPVTNIMSNSRSRVWEIFSPQATVGWTTLWQWHYYMQCLVVFFTKAFYWSHAILNSTNINLLGKVEEGLLVAGVPPILPEEHHEHHHLSVDSHTDRNCPFLTNFSST